MSGFRDRTRVWCFTCKAEHPAEAFEADGAVMCRVECPHAPGTVFSLSSDVELFTHFRSFPQLPAARRFQFALLHVTDRCTMKCPICFASSGDGPPASVGDVLEKARIAKDAGVKAVSLTGGEPTEHPALEELIRRLKRELGLKVVLITNGLAFSRDASLAARLRRTGLSKVVISFDTLSPETSRLMRGDDYMEAKLSAFERAAAAGLGLAANMTVCERNICEVGSVFRLLATRFPALTHVLFQPFADFGRRSLHDRIDRERIVRALCESREFPVETFDSFVPAPNVPAFGIGVHPDCCAVCAVSARGTGVRARLSPLASSAAMRRLCGRLAAIDGSGLLPPSLQAALAWVRFAGMRSLPLFAHRWLCGFGGRAVLAVVDNLPNREFMLSERIERCGSALACADGSLYPACAAYRMGKEKKR